MYKLLKNLRAWIKSYGVVEYHNHKIDEQETSTIKSKYEQG
jgi:hypothetical protein